MGHATTLTAADGFALAAWQDGPPGDKWADAKSGLVVVQEIFGVNSAIRALTDRYAQAGYLAVAPDLFWRFGPGIELDYSRADTLKAMMSDAGFANVSVTMLTFGVAALHVGEKR